jgi:flagellar basal body P-ring formation protein FlgA
MPTRHRTTLGARLLLAAVALVPHGIAQAAPGTDPASHAVSQAEREIRGLLDAQTRELANRFPGRIEVNVGTLDPRLTLAPCQQVEPFLPQGARLWGRSHIGLRCRAGANWQVFLPVDVRIFGPALVTTRALTAQQPIQPEDARVDEVELTREPPGALSDPKDLNDRLAARGLPAGTVLRPELLRARPVIAGGDAVKVVYLGDGFSVASEGKALGPATEGQAIRVQMDSGRVVTGTARDGRRVEIR